MLSFKPSSTLEEMTVRRTYPSHLLATSSLLMENLKESPQWTLGPLRHFIANVVLRGEAQLVAFIHINLITSWGGPLRGCAFAISPGPDAPGKKAHNEIKRRLKNSAEGSERTSDKNPGASKPRKQLSSHPYRSSLPKQVWL